MQNKFILKCSVVFVLLTCSFYSIIAQNDTLKKKIEYSFIIQDSPSQLFTMRQSNQNYLSGYRLLSRGLYAATKNNNIAVLIQAGLEGLMLTALSHEEGHRSILTANHIGSISRPYYNKHGAAYVKGVTDQTLQNLRDNDLPTYIRLHTAGLESDYMLTKRMEAMGSFEQDEFKYFKWEYAFRKYAIMQYYLLGLFKCEIDLKEEKNELDRDIVGFDTYGAVRQLYRPTMPFYRYTKYKDLTHEEKRFVTRMGYRSFLNLLNPLIIGRNNFKISETTKFNFGLGYTMSPFGDFIDENIWLNHKKTNIGMYFRQFQNKQHWFHGFGLSLIDYKPIESLSASVAGHFWQQPKDLNFNTNKSFTGGAIDLDLKYCPFSKREVFLNGYSIDLGFIYKTKGFLPEEVFLKEHFGFRFGTTICL